MSYKTILWFVILVNFTPLSAQQKFSDFKVSFKVNEFVLDKPDLETLDRLVNEAKTAGYYEITLSAHTDNDGSSSYNVSLSGKRARSVRDYLIFKGLNEKVMDVEWYGEARPETSNSNLEGKSVNRRVVITLKQYKLNSIGDVLRSSGGDYSQTFSFNPALDNTITAKNGTTFFLPKDALLTKDGKPLSAELVTLEIQEFQSSRDAIFNQLSTTCEGRILESGGMFNIVAKYNGEELRLKEGKSISIEMPSANIQKDMEIFTGVKNAEGVTEWKATAKPFELRAKNNAEIPSVKLNVAYLKSLKQPVNFKQLKKIEKRYVLPKSNLKPLEPRKPRMTEYPDESSFFTPLQKIFLSSARRERMLAKEYDRIDKRNGKITDRYNRNMATYRDLMAKYPGDSIYYLSSQGKFYDWVKEQLNNCRAEIREYEKTSFNRSIDKLIEKSESNGIKDPLSANSIAGNTSYTEEEKQRMLELFRMSYQLENLQNLEFCEVLRKHAVNGVFDLDRKEADATHAISNYEFTYHFGGNTFTNEFYSSNSGLREAFSQANMELYIKRSKLGLADMNSLNTIYTASISGFGAINCDRFSTTPPEQMVNVEVECEGNSQISFFIPNINSYIYAYKNRNNRYVVKLPAGSNATMVVVGLTEGVPVFLKQKVEIKKKMNLVANPQPATLKQIQAEVASI